MTGLPGIFEDLPDHRGSPEAVAEFERLRELERRLGYKFRRPALLRAALTHGSWCNENGAAGWPSNQSLEFFGDAVLDLVAADALWSRFPERDEGTLTRMRANVVSERALAAAARDCGLGEWLFLGKGEELGGGRDRAASLADAVEAILGATFLDARAAGADPLGAAALVFRALLGSRVDAQAPGREVDPKTQLQHWAQRELRRTPLYETEPSPRSSPSRPSWSARVHLPEADGAAAVVLGVGEGRSMRHAQHAAALAALSALSGSRVRDGDPGAALGNSLDVDEPSHESRRGLMGGDDSSQGASEG